MSIKNFFARGEKLHSGISGLKYARYLINNSHPNHKNTQIIELWNKSEDWIENTIFSASKHNESKSLGKGGRPTERFGHSYVLSLPKGAKKPTKKEWQEILTGVIKAISTTSKIPPKDILNSSYIVIHNQNNPHAHILISSVINSKTINQQLSSQVTMKRIKAAFDFSCAQTLGLHKEQHIPNINLSRKISKLKHLEKLTNNAENQLRKLLSSISERNEKQYNRQMNRLIKTIQELENEDAKLANEIKSKIKRITIQENK